MSSIFLGTARVRQLAFSKPIRLLCGVLNITFHSENTLLREFHRNFVPRLLKNNDFTFNSNIIKEGQESIRLSYGSKDHFINLNFYQFPHQILQRILDIDNYERERNDSQTAN
ncbi:conserved Plasmodium protein, unknown function [Babesia microti strain RI]|uniref:Uncharacterized protein n=1 Tax=Babesia microti (strain RI) TaxID=1133968 RepID=I7IGE3_BABMR|nr:conserved Plasmodium protein, unknown function [Babesia microti strain RI]CCF73711.1 conserved Plasmodium protein, unknown function [Babesia microti strain RI]|eukprot:XP_012648320.1 conserved Plasmodium protein, unknown function [Babesia microti strain RI]